MTLFWADLWLMALMVAAGCAASYWFAMRKVRQAMAESQRDMERRLSALTEALTMREAEAGDAVASTDALDAAEIEAEPAPVLEGRPLPRIEVQRKAAPDEKEEIAPEIQAAIAAAAVAVLGNHARVREARRVPSQDVVSPWTQQGRVIVQSSHNLRARGR